MLVVHERVLCWQLKLPNLLQASCQHKALFFMEIVNYTTVNHEARKKLGLSISEYCVADIIYQLSNNPKSNIPGWCYASKETIGEYLGISKRGVNKIIARLIESGLAERNDERISLIRMTFDWYGTVIIKREQSSQVGTNGTITGNKVPKKREQSSHYKDINKDINNNINSNGQAIAGKEVDKLIVLDEVAGKEINDLIALFEPINPNFERLFSNTTQRDAMQRMYKKFGYEKITRMMNKLPEVLALPYSPTISTPLQLENKLGELVMFVRKQQSQKKGGFVDATKIQGSMDS